MARQPVTALVVAAERPLDNRVPRKRGFMDSAVWILVNTTPPLVVVRDLRLDHEHWLVAGMQIPVQIDLSEPGDFEVDWDGIPSIEQRVTAQDRTLADPLGTHRGVLDTLLALKVQPTDERTFALVSEAQQVASGARPIDRMTEVMKMAAALTPPPGRLAAAVVVATAEQTLKQHVMSGDRNYRNDYGYFRDSSGTHRAVLSVYMPGRAPYAIYVPEFHRPNDAKVPQLALAIPAYVSAGDPGDVDVRWDEAAAFAHKEREWQQDLAAGRGAPLGFPAAGIPKQPALPPELRAAAAAQARQMLESAPPGMRDFLLQQYRSAGIEI